MPKYQEFFYNLLNLQRSLNVIKDIVKEEIGDSVNNHRTLTVNQVIRFTKKTGTTNFGKRLSKQLTVVAGVLTPKITTQRRLDGVNRTDAIDINELVSVYREVVMNKRQMRQQIGRLI